ncbi:MAG: hypothetical protein Q8P41_18560 [Pseudomonadota bacterium]|nr:hypothetical protein [Pseudomonadota bacterium]
MDETTDAGRKRQFALTAQKLGLIRKLGQISDEDVARHEAQVRLAARQKRALFASACVAAAALLLVVALGMPQAVEARPPRDTTFAVYGPDSDSLWCERSFCFQSKAECEDRGWTCSEYSPTAGPPMVAMGCGCPAIQKVPSGELFIEIVCQGQNAGGDVDVKTYAAGDRMISTGRFTLPGSPATTKVRSRPVKMRWHSHLGHGRFLITASSGPYEVDELNGAQEGDRLPGLNATVELSALNGPVEVLASAPAKCTIE